MDGTPARRERGEYRSSHSLRLLGAVRGLELDSTGRLAWFRFECLFYCVENDANVAKKCPRCRRLIDSGPKSLTCPSTPPPPLAAVCLIWAVDHLAGDVDTAPVVFYGQAIVSSISYAIKFKYTCDKNQILLDI